MSTRFSAIRAYNEFTTSKGSVMLPPPDLTQRAADLLATLDSNPTSSNTYNTAFIASLSTAAGTPCFPQALDWLRSHQHADGSWGAMLPVPVDRLVSTLAAVASLAECRQPWAENAVRTGVDYLWEHSEDWRASPHQTSAFELAVPYLLDQGRRAGLNLPAERFTDIEQLRTAKLGRLPAVLPSDAPSPLLYSAELLSPQLLARQAERFQAEDGSIGCSPAATAALCRHGDNAAAESFLRRLAARSPDGGFPELAPIEIFILGWALYPIVRAGLRPAGIDKHLATLRGILATDGLVTMSAAFPLPDADDTAMAMTILHRAGTDVTPYLPHLLTFERDTYFTCYEFERDGSVAVNARIVEAFSPEPQRYAPQIEKAAGFIADHRIDGAYWYDKWHTSPYYATAHVAFGLASTAPELLNATARWLRETQHPDGSWGAAQGQPEETAYAVLALDALVQAGLTTDTAPMTRAFAYLCRHVDDNDTQYAEMWNGRGLFTAPHLTRSAIIAALQLATAYL
ncbi:prenyltransferase/squalene oxidase repeat-containing protein [Streptomyces niveus]|uniref:prenyltransferase/squalene oxidase repeat-containing protein n=1 Tax=Streptomyces niveus TaxID=193462 RepID=UPI0036823187